MNPMIERVARALWNADSHGAPADYPVAVLKPGREKSERFERGWMSRVDEARAAIAEMREPTDAMVEEGADACRSYDGFKVQGTDASSDCWTRMIDEALEE